MVSAGDDQGEARFNRRCGGPGGANKLGASKIWAGAGPIGGVYSPTTLTVIFVYQSLATSSTAQYSQANSDGATWNAMDATNLKLTFTPAMGGAYGISTNADLFTSVAGYNQDIGIMASGGAYGTGTLVTWKESGGFAGTFSPNAAFVDTALQLQGGTAYTFTVVWKANRAHQVNNAIWAGAGPVNTHYSTTSLTAHRFG